ncbi:32 kDa beta-galactoside-binding lectin, partial [Trichinella sp. T8]
LSPTAMASVHEKDEHEKKTLMVPYLSRLEDKPVEPGQSLHIRGVLLGDKYDDIQNISHHFHMDNYKSVVCFFDYRFDVNMQTGSKDVDDIPFHMGFRRKDKVCLMNSQYLSQWGKEERKKISLKENEAFDLRIRAHDSKFEIFLNQKELCEYDYRQVLTSINYISITGDIELNQVKWAGKYYPVPYEACVKGGFPVGKTLFITGVPEKKAKRFAVNILTGNCDIALHLNVRFDEKCIVRNSRIGGSWQAEEREGKFPLEKDHMFDLMIANEGYAFQIYFGDIHWCAFAHRIDPNTLKGMRIEGDLELHEIHVDSGEPR